MSRFVPGQVTTLLSLLKLSSHSGDQTRFYHESTVTVRLSDIFGQSQLKRICRLLAGGYILQQEPVIVQQNESAGNSATHAVSSPLLAPAAGQAAYPALRLFETVVHGVRHRAGRI